MSGEITFLLVIVRELFICKFKLTREKSSSV